MRHTVAFAGSTGRGTVIESIAAGRRTVRAVNRYLSGNETPSEANNKTTDSLLDCNVSSLKKAGRVSLPTVPPHEITVDTEDTTGFGLDEIKLEADRCFNCSCFAVNSSDIAVVLLALGASVKIQGPGGIKVVPIEDFFSSARNILQTDEVVSEIRIPRLLAGVKQTYIKFRLRQAIDFPLVSVAVILAIKEGICSEARIALGAVAPKPIRSVAAEQALQGKPLNEATAEAAAQAVTRNAMPLSKNAHKVQILRTLVKRAILSGNDQ